MKIMTQEDYTGYEGGRCPACSSEDISSTEQMEHHGISVSQLIICDACGASWSDIFLLAGYDALVDTDQNSLMKE